ncbi:hypothetical protein RS030_3426 [Cryptosporidium xiaoi]|uniref:Nop14-like family protein n=1 Tax=Cryptosporidium xiaoi TaxID=659607 RepID=A0AAV9XVM6_9CRYT
MKLRGEKEVDLSSFFDSVKHQKKNSHIKVIKGNKRKDVFSTFDLNNKRDFGERKRLLLKELYKEGRCGEFNDERERFSTNKGLSSDQSVKNIIAAKLLKKLHSSRNKKKKSNFNLEEENEVDYDNNGLGFTHKGTSLFSINDTEIRNYSDFDDNDDELGDDYTSNGRFDSILDDKTIPGFFFGQGNDSGISASNMDDTPKSRQEVFREIMNKSKLSKIEMKRNKEALEEELLNLDNSFKDVQSLLTLKQSKKERIKSLASEILNKDGNFNGSEKEILKENANNRQENDDYERIRSELKFDTRSGVSDRIKTKEEIAKINLERLEKLEIDRRNRMNMDTNFELESEEECTTNYQSEASSSENEPSDCSEDKIYINEDLSENEEHIESNDSENDETEKDVHLEYQFKGISPKYITEFLEFDDNMPINWLKNEDNEADLPFSCNLKKILKKYNLNELINFLGNFSPISQWKFISRFRACFSSSETGMLNDLKLLFGFLIKYPLKCINYAQNNPDNSGTNRIIFKFIIKYLKLMTGHLLFMTEADPKECLIVFTYFTLDICCTTFPDIKKSRKVEKFLNEQLLDVNSENYYTEILEDCHSLYEDSNDIYEPNLEQILICRMMFLIFPITDAQHPILTPVISCLEQWAYRWSQIGKSFLNPIELDNNHSKYDQIRLVNKPNLDCMIGLINLLEIASIGYYNKMNSSTSDNLERFSIGYFSLSLSCLKWIITSEKDLNLRNVCVSIGILNSLNTVIDKFKDIQGFHVPLIHLVIPNVSEIKNCIHCNPNIKKKLGDKHYNEVTSLISNILNVSIYISNKRLKPVALCPRQTPTIRSLTPKLDDPSVPFAAKAMLKSKHKSKESQYDFEKRLYLSKLKKEVNTARRQANRQIRKDSQVLASISSENKLAKTTIRDAKYNSFMKMLQDDQAEYKRMKTTGGTMDTSVESYRSNKKKKKENRRMGGNKTETGMVH